MIEHVDNAFVLARHGNRLAEMTYHVNKDGVTVIDHTLVHDSLRGQGVARKLLDALVEWARATNTKVIAHCSYAKAQFEKDPSIRDVLA